MADSRTKNSIRNFKFGVFSQVAKIVFNFIVRTIFIRILGSEYLGLNGLFTNILTILSFAELGIGNAIIFNMYKPIAENNTEKIKSLMSMYKNAYEKIGIIVLIVGLSVVPFLNFIVKDAPNIKESLILIYILFLLNTVSSYFLTYKKSIITGYQKEYIINKYNVAFYIVTSLLQILVLFVFKEYLLYLIIQIGCTIIENIALALKANKMYPYLREKNHEEISIEEKKSIFKNIKSLAIYKFGSVVLNGTDNIIISILLGVSLVGVLSNYTLIIGAVIGIVGTALTGITASIGNLNVTAKVEDKKKIFYQLFFITVWLYGFCSVALLNLLNPFIELWVGKEYVLPQLSVIALVLHFYVNGIQFVGYSYRMTTGLFEKGKISPFIAAVLNIILSIVLCNVMGLAGILFATSISRLLTTVWLDPYLVHKYEFKSSVSKFYLKYLLYLLVVTFSCIFCMFIIGYINESTIASFILKMIVVILSNFIFILFFFRTEEFKSLLKKFKIQFLKRNVSNN